VAYHAITDVLRSNFYIAEDDDDHRIRDKVIKGMRELGADEASDLPYVLELLSVKDSGIDQISMSPEARRDRTMEVARRMVLRGAEIRPIVVAIEDLHYIDRSSEETLKMLLDSISGARVLFLLTYRPDFIPTWGSRSYHSQLTLNRLSNRESLAMVAYLLGTEEIETDLQELILEKTEGIPFFLEEFIASLKDLSMIEWRDRGYHLAKDLQDVSIPSTIHDVIMARVDSLPEGAKGVLQTGSVIEREFSYELIRRVTGLQEAELLSHLSALRDSELLYERGIYPQATLVFRHALTRDVLYDSILTAKRKRLHLTIADTIEELYKDSLDEHCVALTEHYIAGGNYEMGAHYCRLTERRAEKAVSLNDAIAHAEKRVACLEKLPHTEDVDLKIIDARTVLGLYWLQMNHFGEAKEAVDPIVDLALARGLKRRVAQIYTILGCHSYTAEEDFPKAFQYLEEALKTTEELRDSLSLVVAKAYLATALAYNCEYERALQHFEEGLQINMWANSIWGVALFKSAATIFAINPQGRIDLGHRTTEEALAMAEESGDILSKAWAYTGHGCSCYYRGLLGEAEEYLLKGIGFCQSIDLLPNLTAAYLFLSDAYFDMGEYGKCLDCLETGISRHEQSRYLPVSMGGMLRAAWARAKVMSGEKGIDLELLYHCEAENRLKWFEGMIARYVGETLLNLDDQHLSEAEVWIDKAIEADKGNGTMLNLAADYALHGELMIRKDNLPQARKSLNKAIKIFGEGGADGWVTRTEETLKALSGRK
jgi:tetratricopeptide (TPR) repeat protein